MLLLTNGYPGFPLADLPVVTLGPAMFWT